MRRSKTRQLALHTSVIKYFLACLFLLTQHIVFCFSQKPTPTPERDREIVALLSGAELAAPELAADIFLRVLESKRVTDRAWRKEILDEALRIAEGVKHPVQLRPVPIKGVTLNDRERWLRSRSSILCRQPSRKSSNNR